MTTTVEICSCGHPTSKHEFPDTDYSICRTWGGEKCYCSGGVRPAVLVTEQVENPSMMQTVARYFKRQFRVGSPEHNPLNSGIEKARAEDAEVEWVVDYCDRCGGERDRDLYAWMIDSAGQIQFSIRELTGKFELICKDCEDDERRNSIIRK